MAKETTSTTPTPVVSGPTTTVENGNLVVRMPLNADPPVSKSGKSRIAASTHGYVRTQAQWQGKLIRLDLNAIVDL